MFALALFLGLVSGRLLSQDGVGFLILVTLSNLIVLWLLKTCTFSLGKECHIAQEIFLLQ